MVSQLVNQCPSFSIDIDMGDMLPHGGLSQQEVRRISLCSPEQLFSLFIEIRKSAPASDPVPAGAYILKGSEEPE